MKIKCPSCLTVLDIEDDYFAELAGKAIACPQCDHKIQIPASATSGRLPKKTEERFSQRRLSRSAIWTIAGVVAGLVLTVAFAIFKAGPNPEQATEEIASTLGAKDSDASESEINTTELQQNDSDHNSTASTDDQLLDDSYNTKQRDEEVAQQQPQYTGSELCDMGMDAVNRGDNRKAVEYFTAGAKAGDSSCQYNLGVAYKEGLGVQSDLRAALYWFTQAANQGSQIAEQACRMIIKHNQQANEAAVQNYLLTNYGECSKAFQTEEDAVLDANRWNRAEETYMRRRRNKVELWQNYNMAGAPHPGPSVTFHIAKVVYDQNIGLWVMYVEEFATF